MSVAVPQKLTELSPNLDPHSPTEITHATISVNEETPTDNSFVITSTFLRIYSIMKPNVIPSPSPLSFLNSSIFTTHQSSDKLPNLPLLKPY